MNVELKDYFAAKALQGLLSLKTQLSIEDIVITSYNIAEKMIERKHELINQKYVNTSKQIKLDNIENL